MDVITFKNVSKHFNIYTNKANSLKETVLNTILNRNKLEVKQFLVLDNANFAIKKGETVGIIGENGIGKSTTLKIVARIISPNSGKVIVKGKVSSLLEVGAGFHPELTGRENVYLYGAILGLKKKTIDARYDDIVQFAEIEGFMDSPVKNYSSGMYMRLAFSVAINVDPDILVVDEVLAVGDENFQKKCLRKIDQFKEKGVTILFVSHDMSAVKRICDRVIFVQKGGKVSIGDNDDKINEYMKKVYGASPQPIKKVTKDKKALEYEPHLIVEDIDQNRWGDRLVEIDTAFFSDNKGEIKNLFTTNEDVVINVAYNAKEKIDRAVLGIAIYDDEGHLLSGPNSKNDGFIITELEGKGSAKVTVCGIPFLKGRYLVTVALYDYACQIPFDHREKHYAFQVLSGKIEQAGIIKIDCKWQLS